MKGSIFFGIVVVAVGSLLLLMELDLVPVRGIGGLLVFIPSLFILLGLYLLVVQKFKRAAGPIVMIAISTVVQLMLLDVLLWKYMWPVVFILIGVAIIAGGVDGHRRRKRRRERRRMRERRHPTAEARTTAEGYLDISVTVSGCGRRAQPLPRTSAAAKSPASWAASCSTSPKLRLSEPPARISTSMSSWEA